MAIERTPTREHPAMFDKPIKEMQLALAAGLPWLQHSFGRGERLVKIINGKKYYTPNLYVGKNEYRLITPDDRIGSYSFFMLEEPQTMEFEAGVNTRLSAPFSLIVWADMRKASPDDTRDTEAVKRQILQVLNGGFLMRTGYYTITRIYERAENVFDGFTMDEVNNQFLMHPFAGWRFYGELHINECMK